MTSRREAEPENLQTVLGKFTIPQRPHKSPPSEVFDDEKGSDFKHCSRAQQQARAAAHHEFLQSIGKRYHGAKLDTYRCQYDAQAAVKGAVEDYLESLVEHVESGRGIMLFGPKGTGKDHLAVAVARQAIARGYSARWMNGLDWFGDLRDGIGRDARESQQISLLTRPDLLLLSDPLPLHGDLSQHQSAQLWRVIDRRYRDLKPTIVTLNVSTRSEAEQRMGASLVDRLAHNSLTLFCNWESFRKNS